MLHLDHKPIVPSSCFVARSADLIGKVTLGPGASVWFQTVLRADVMPITIGENTNVQDGSVIHGSLGKAETVVGNNVTIGHRVTLHGCTIEDDCLIGMGATVMDNAVIPKGSIVGAGALVTERSTFEPGSLILGSPAKALRAVKPHETEWVRNNARHYLKYASSYKTNEVNYYESK